MGAHPSPATYARAQGWYCSVDVQIGLKGQSENIDYFV